MAGARGIVALALVALTVAAPAAEAEHLNRPSQPVCRTTTHFVIHCNAGLSASYISAAAADFEESYSRLVAGGGGSPNAALKAPVDDGDGRTDVYLSTPPGRPDFRGGTVYGDINHFAGRGTAGYVFMTPSMSRPAFRFRAAHEFMHVIGRGYRGDNNPLYEEGLANWAAEVALPDVDPGDTNFSHPFTPLDCGYGSWKGTSCGSGYWQWLFFIRQTEDFGVGFVAGVQRRFESGAIDNGMSALKAELAVRTGRPASQALRLRFADYARKVVDSTLWRSNAAKVLIGRRGTPQLDADIGLHSGFSDTGPRTVSVDHLAARYARVTAGGSPDDDLRLSMTPPPGLIAAPDVLIGDVPGPYRRVPLARDPAGGFATTIPGPEEGTQVVFPLVNDTENADNRPFTWRAQLLTARADIAVPAQRLRRGLKRGLVVDVTTSKPVAVNLNAYVRRSVARRYKLGRRQTRITAVARKSIGPGTTRMRLKFTSKARKRLRKAKKVRLFFTGGGAFPRGTRVELDAVRSLKR